MRTSDIDHEKVQEEIQKKSKMIVNDHHGTYIPEIFLSRFRDKLKVENLSEDDLDTLEHSNPRECDYYHELWTTVLDFGKLEIDGETYKLAQNGDLFAVKPDMSQEAWDMFYY